MQKSSLSTTTFLPVHQENIICSLVQRNGADPPLDRSRGVIHLPAVSFVCAVREDYHNWSEPDRVYFKQRTVPLVYELGRSINAAWVWSGSQQVGSFFLFKYKPSREKLWSFFHHLLPPLPPFCPHLWEKRCRAFPSQRSQFKSVTSLRGNKYT